MLWNASTVNGFEVTATDGPVGKVVDLLFDEGWLVRWVIVEAAAAPNARQLRLPSSELSKPDADVDKLVANLTVREVEESAVVQDGQLQSALRIIGYDMAASDGEIGHVDDVLINDWNWQIRFLTTDALSGKPGEQVMISRRAISAIDADKRLIRLSVDRQAVKDSPSYDEGISVDGADDEPSLSYFGIKFIRRGQDAA